jgi:hypothetical protein
VGPCAETRAIAKKGSTTLNTKAARDNPDLLFILMSFSMVWLGLVLGIINILRGDKFFFHFFEKIFERPGRAICLRLVRSGRFRSRLRAGLRIFVCASKCVSVRSFACARMTKEPATGRYPSCEVWSYILYKYTPSSLRLETGGIFFPWLIICAPGCVAGL